MTPQTLSAASSPVKAIWRTQNDHALTLGLVSKMSQAEFRRIALRTLSPADIRVATLRVYPTIDDWQRAKGLGGTDCEYENWRAALERRGLTARPLICPEVSEALKIGGSILVRRIDKRCRSTQAILQGDRDPLQVTLPSFKFRILDVFIQPISEERLANKDKFSPITFFAQTTNEPSVEDARELLTHFLNMGIGENVSVAVRKDPWYISDCVFPVLFLFDTLQRTAPSRKEYLGSKEARCVKQKQWPIQCY